MQITIPQAAEHYVPDLAEVQSHLQLRSTSVALHFEKTSNFILKFPKIFLILFQ